MSIPPPLPDTGSGPVSVPPPLPAEPPVVAPPLDSPRDPRHSRFASFLVFLMGMFLLYPVAQLIGPAALPSQRAKIAIEQGYFQLDNEEGALLYLTLELGRGHTMYRPLTEFPYVVGTYPPVSYTHLTLPTNREV